MSEVPDATGVTSADEGGGFDLDQASEILEATQRRARQLFDVWPPFLLLIGAVIFLVAYGAVWWSVRGQAPFVGPSGGALAIFYGCIIVWIVVVSAVVRRALQGVSGGPSLRRRKYNAGFGIILIADFVLQGALYHAGASHAIVYGIYPAVAPFFFAGPVFVTMGVLREERLTMAFGIGLIAVGTGGAYAGPATAWLVAGIALAAALAGFAAIRYSRQRA
ncbi:MAG: hypothetical protein ACHQFZ_06630 [Acidimicrobiales bacterium]